MTLLKDGPGGGEAKSAGKYRVAFGNVGAQRVTEHFRPLRAVPKK